MALKRWVWIGAPALAALLVMVALLPPSLPSESSTLLGMLTWGNLYRFGSSSDRDRSQFTEDLRAARQNQETYLRRAGLVDSIAAAARGARALRSADGQVTLVYERPLTPDSARFWLRAVSRELALYPKPPAHGVPVIVALFSDPERMRPGRPSVMYEWGVQEYPDQAASAGTCVVTVSLLNRQTFNRTGMGHDATGDAVSRLLGVCAVYARFGEPGARVGRWARAGFSWWTPFTSLLLEAHRRVRRDQLPRTSDWGNNPWFGEVLWLEVGCLRGAADLCLRSAGIRGPTDDAYPFYYSSQPLRTRVLAHALATGTAEQFAAFWRSPLAPDSALAAAYGEPAERVAQAALAHWFEAPVVEGGWGSMRGTVAGAAWIALALAVAMAAGRRRKTEL